MMTTSSERAPWGHPGPIPEYSTLAKPELEMRLAD
jgi:hypothetical protein